MKVSELTELLSSLDPELTISIQDEVTNYYYKVVHVETSRTVEEGEQEAFLIIKEEEF